jgi:hypothetical protein
MRRLLAIMIAAVVVGLSAAPIKSMLGANGIGPAYEEFPEKPTAKDYIQDGLIAIWDGIENAGWGVHDPNATVWKDLIGDNDLALNDCIWTNTHLVFNGSSSYGSISKVVSGATIEIAMSLNSDANQVIFVPAGYSSKPCVGIFNKMFMSSSQNNLPLSTFNSSIKVATTLSLIHGGTSYYALYQDAVICTKNSVMQSYDSSGTITYMGRRSSGTYMNGIIFAGRVYSRALTAEEVAHNYAVDYARFFAQDEEEEEE